MPACIHLSYALASKKLDDLAIANNNSSLHLHINTSNSGPSSIDIDIHQQQYTQNYDNEIYHYMAK